MKSKKIIAAILAVAMMVTSIQFPPVQVSAEETMIQSTGESSAIYLNQETPVDAEDSSKDIPVSVLSVTAGDEQSSDLDAENVLDNDHSSLWHTDWNGTSYENHYITFELREDYIVSGLRYKPRSSGGTNGTITKYKIFVSDDGIEWEQVTEGNWTNNASWKVANFDGQQTKYVRLKSDEAATQNPGNVFASAAEIRLVGSQPEPEGEMSAISVKTAPRTVYSVGQTFDPTGLVLNLIYADGQTRELAYSNEAEIIFNTGALTSENTAVEITYGEFMTTLPIKVMEGEILETVPEIAADDDSRDVPFDKLTAIAGSAYNGGLDNEGPASYVLDNNVNTHWHTDWSTSEGADVAKRWIGLELVEATKIDGIRFLPRTSGADGRPTEYRVEYRATEEGDWIPIDGATGTWDRNNADWKRVNFEPVNAVAVRLVGVHTYANGGEDIHMSAAEFRVTVPSYDAAINTLTPSAGSEYTPGTDNEGPASFVLDNNVGTHWHTDWQTSEGDDEANRWIGLKLDKAATIDGIRFLARTYGGNNGTPTEYRVEYRATEDGEWRTVATGTWSWNNNYSQWRRVSFAAVEAKEVRLVGVQTHADAENKKNKHMSAAELRVTKPIVSDAEKTLEAIHINEAPNILYTVGDTFDPIGLKLIRVYSDGSSDLFEYSAEAGIEVSQTEAFREAGTKTVTFTYQEKTTTLDVVVQPVPKLTNVEVSKAPKTIYAEGETFDPTGLKVQLVYDNKAKVVDTYAGNPSAFTFAPNTTTALVTDNDSVKITYTVGDESFEIDLSIDVKNSEAFAEYQTKKEELDTLKTELDNVINDANALLRQKNEEMERTGAELEEAQTEAFNALQAEVDEPSNVGEMPEVTEESSLEDINSAKAAIETAKEVVTEKTAAINNAITNVRDIYVDNSEAKLAGNSLVLEGTIGLNFYMILSDEVHDNTHAYMNFTIEREGKTPEERNLPLNGVESVKVTVEEEQITCYPYKCSVPVKDMGAVIKAQIIILDDDDETVLRKGLVYTYKVEDYITKVSKNPEKYDQKDNSAALKTLVDTMSDFGDFASVYFAKGKVTDEEMLARIENVNKDALAAYAPVTGNIPATRDIYYGSSLLLKADTELRHYFNEDVEVVSVIVNGEEIEKESGRYSIVEKEGTGKYYLEYTGIGAHELGDAITVTVKTKVSVDPKTEEPIEVTIVYSPLTYAYIALDNESEATENLADLMRAMYLYQKAAVAYNN